MVSLFYLDWVHKSISIMVVMFYREVLVNFSNGDSVALKGVTLLIMRLDCLNAEYFKK